MVVIMVVMVEYPSRNVTDQTSEAQRGQDLHKMTEQFA